MKSVMLAVMICLGFLLSGCFRPESPVDAQGRLVATKTQDGFELSFAPYASGCTFRYVMVDGHEYIIIATTHRSGMAHSPRCPCRSKERKTDGLQED